MMKYRVLCVALLAMGLSQATYADGIDGKFEKNKPTGCLVWNFPSLSSDEIRTYQGGCTNGYANGKGILVDDNNNRYEGDFKDGKRHGRGVQIWASGSKYEGDWKNDEQHGKGVEIDSLGERYEGDWKNGKQNGKGVLTRNNKRYEGIFVNNSFQVSCNIKTSCTKAQFAKAKELEEMEQLQRKKAREAKTEEWERRKREACEQFYIGKEIVYKKDWLVVIPMTVTGVGKTNLTVRYNIDGRTQELSCSHVLEHIK